MSGVTLNQVGLTYPDGFTALREIHLQIADGEFVALIGPSGSGKTSLLRLVAGFLAPTEGTISIGGTEVASPAKALPPEQRKLGMVFQQHAIWPHLNVGDNVGYPLKIAKLPRAEINARVDEVLELVGMIGYAHRNPATLSGGQRQRVALARALAPRPRVLLLDEALSALDEPLRDQLRVELKSLTARMGLTVLHVTHDRDEALAIGDRIAVLDLGRIVQLDTPAELLRNPATPFVARFLSDATIVDGRVDDAGFRSSEHPLHVPHDRLVGAAPGPGKLAILPQDLTLTSNAAGAAEVISSLFGRAASDVLVEWDGLKLRCESDWHPRVGARVDVQVERGVCYPAR